MMFRRGSRSASASLLWRLGGFSASRPWRVISGWLMVTLVVIVSALGFGKPPTESVRIPGAPAENVRQELERRFPAQSGGRAIAVFATDTGRIDQGAPRAAVVAAMAKIERVEHVRTVISPTGPAGPLLTSDDGRVAWAQIVFDRAAFDVPQQSIDQLVATGDLAKQAGLRVGFGGQPLERVQTESTRTGEMIGLLVAMVVLLVAFGSLGAACVPLALAAVTVGIGFAWTRLLGSFTDVNLVAQAMSSMIGLAVGIDYALFIVTRYRQGVGEGLDTPTAAARANDTAGRSVIFAGGTVVVSMLGLTAVGIPVVDSLSFAVSLTVAAAVVASITLLPALLGLVGGRLDAVRVPFTRRSSEVGGGGSILLSARWARAVARRPALAFAVGTAVLLVLAAPFLSLQTGWPDARHRAADDPARVAFDLMTDGFGIGSNAPLVVALDSGDPAQVGIARDWLASLPDVASVSPALPNDVGDLSLVQVTPSGGPEASSTASLVRRIRGASGLPATAPAVSVTGATAFYVDLDARMSDRLGWFVGAVVALSLVLLTAVFRAPLVALKAALMNLLGIGAAYGVVVAVFQWGWASSLIGVDRPVPVVSTLPIVLFAVLFGLSMDYEVFILSRIREAWKATGDNTEAIVDGLAASSRVVTAAAVIMFAVFAGFVTSPSIEIKMTGFGLAVAVLLDATVIRQLLVPASMTLLGRRNWWIPRWMDRILPDLDVEGVASESPPAREHVVVAEAVPTWRS